MHTMPVALNQRHCHHLSFRYSDGCHHLIDAISILEWITRIELIYIIKDALLLMHLNLMVRLLQLPLLLTANIESCIINLRRDPALCNFGICNKTFLSPSDWCTILQWDSIHRSQKVHNFTEWKTDALANQATTAVHPIQLFAIAYHVICKGTIKSVYLQGPIFLDNYNFKN